MDVPKQKVKGTMRFIILSAKIRNKEKWMYSFVSTLVLILIILSYIALGLVILINYKRVKKWGMKELSITGIAICIVICAVSGLLIMLVEANNPYDIVNTHQDYTYIRDGETLDLKEVEIEDYVYHINDSNKTIEVKPYRIFGIPLE